MDTKLRVLCLHGHNTTKEIMKFQMENFESTFGSLCHFTYIDSPMDCEQEPVAQLVKMGFKLPFKGWAELSKIPCDNRAEINYKDTVTDSVKFLVNYLNENGPFDAIFGFS